jgi:hypothetical protein
LVHHHQYSATLKRREPLFHRFLAICTSKKKQRITK